MDELKSTRAAVPTRYALLSVKGVNPECSLAIRSSEIDIGASLECTRSAKTIIESGGEKLAATILGRRPLTLFTQNT